MRPVDVFESRKAPLVAEPASSYEVTPSPADQPATALSGSGAFVQLESPPFA
jgi:hypothetical protein